jgi:hypothetical protein
VASKILYIGVGMKADMKTEKSTPRAVRKVKGAPVSSWSFARTLRRGAFGWRGSALAGKRIKAALAEIRAAAKKDSARAGEGAVLLLEKIVPAVAHVDSSTGALGAAVNAACVECANFIEHAGWSPEERAQWLERLSGLLRDDSGYLDHLGDEWGRMCGGPELASSWADRLMEGIRASWNGPRGGSYFYGSSACLSCLLAAARHREIFELLGLQEGRQIWPYQRYGFKSYLVQGLLEEALRFTDDYLQSDVINKSETWVYHDCELALRAVGRFEEAYERYALRTHESNTNLGIFRSLAKDYPGIDRGRILRDLISYSPLGDEGKWFATAKELGEFEVALKLVESSPCQPTTLTRAAADYVDKNPEFALGAALAALRWLCEGYGYEISSLDVLAAYRAAIEAAMRLGREAEIMRKVSELVGADASKGKFVTKTLAGYLRRK